MGALAALSIGALLWLAPSGLFLLGFLGVVILAHEAGHLLAARRAGMQPTEYFWGFGPEIIAIERGGCRYGLKLLFLGGYVRLIGMTPSSELPDGFDEAGTYRSASHRGRLATILAGPAVNIVMAWLAFAAAAAIEGQGVGSALVGGGGEVWHVVSGTGQALWLWVANIGDYLVSVVDTSGASQPPVRFMSPVSQAEVSGWAVENGVVTSLRWFAVLSSAIGVVNLLPLPPLDGAHALVAVAEGILDRLRRGTKVRLDVTRLLPLAYLTLGALVLLSVTALVMDIRTLT
jgi:membrane-associated protease RseP (regulator of RpoE activity)